jgi:ABC-type amino acid transport substrate-binding protein
MWPDYFGISYLDPLTGQLQGLDIDMSKALAEDLNVKLTYVNTSFADFIDQLNSRECEIAMMAAGVTESRQQRVDFSEPYLRSDIYFITNRTNRVINTVEDIDQPGIINAVQKGTLMESFLSTHLQYASLSIVSAPGARELEVESGRADAFATDYPYIQRFLQNTDWARLVDPTTPLKLTDYAYAIRKDDLTWLDTVNAFVKRIKQDGRLLAAADKNLLTPIVVKD